MYSQGLAAVRALLAAETRPVGWPARRRRLDTVASIDGVAADIALEACRFGHVSGGMVAGARQ